MYVSRKWIEALAGLLRLNTTIVESYVRMCKQMFIKPGPIETLVQDNKKSFRIPKLPTKQEGIETMARDKNRKFVALKWIETSHNNSFEPYERIELVTIFPDREHIYWGLDRQYYMNYPKNAEIVKEYPVGDNPDYTGIEVDFIRNFKPIKPTPKEEYTDCYGWISPSGDLYTCGYCEHESTAFKICASVYGIFAHSEHLEQDWIKITDGYIFHAKEFTQAQLDTLFDLYQVANDDTKALLQEYISVSEKV